MVDATLRRDLNRDGCVVVRGALDVAPLAALLEEFRDVFRRQMRRLGLPGASATGQRFDAGLTDLFQASMPSYLAAAKLTQYLPSLHRLGAGGAVLDLIRALGLTTPVISTRPVVHIVTDAVKVPGGYHRTPTHQDWRSVQGSLDSLVVWLPLVPVDKDFSPLEIIPGSHLRGLLKTVPHPFGSAVVEGEVDDADFIPVEVGPGDVVAISMFLVHRTGMQQRPGIRWSVSLRYNNIDESSYIERDFPNPYIYRPRDDLMIEGFPDRDAVARIYQDD